MVSLLCWISLASAGELVVPSYTPGTVGDFGPAERLTEETLSALQVSGLPFAAPSEVIRRGGGSVVACADQEACPARIFEVFPGSSLALVGSTTWKNGRLESEMRFYIRGDASPVEVLTASFRPEDSGAFANEIARIADELLLFSPETEGAVLEVAQEPESPVAPEAPARERLREGLGKPEVPAGAVPGKGHHGEEMPWPVQRLPPGAQSRWLISDLSWQEWRHEKALRTGAVEVGVLGGMAFGDLDRSYDVRIALDDGAAGFEEIGSFQAHDFIVGRGPAAAFYVSFAPAWWVDLGLTAGVQSGEKNLSTGWEQYVEGSLEASDVENHDAAFALIGVLEPRLRLFLVPLGPVKPYLSGSLGLRFLDGYQAPDLDDVAYPDLAGGLDTTIGLGGGLCFDLPLGLTLTLDVPWSYRLNEGPLVSEAEGQALASQPIPAEPSRQVLSFRAGAGVRL